MKIAFVGDICLAPDMPRGIFLRLKQEVCADMLVGNLECCLTNSDNKIQPKYANLKATPDLIDALEGLDVAIVANNHVYDYGVKGAIDTVNILNDNGISCVGLGRNIEMASRGLHIECQGVKISICAFSCHSTNGKYYADVNNEGVSPLFYENVISSVAREKANHDAVVVYFHWGVEQSHYPVPEQMAMASQAIEAGADCIIGCHPHVIQGMEFYSCCPVFYSLGNYYFPDINVMPYGYKNNSSNTTLLQRLENKEKCVATVIIDNVTKKITEVQPCFYNSQNVQIKKRNYSLLSFDYFESCMLLRVYRRFYGKNLFKHPRFSLTGHLQSNGVTFAYSSLPIDQKIFKTLPHCLRHLFIKVLLLAESFYSKITKKQISKFF